MTLDQRVTPAASDARPRWAAATPAVTLDVRPLLARGEEPFGAIMAAARQVSSGAVLQLLSPFEPFPLYRVLGSQGFQHWAHQRDPGTWEVLFCKAPPEAQQSAGDSAPAHPAVAAPGTEPEEAWPAPSRTVTIDVSDLVPPEPMIRILEALEQIRPGEALLVNHVRRPVYLYARLDELGYRHRTRELGPQQVEVVILKPSGGEGANV